MTVITKRSDELRPGDVLSTDGSTVETAILLQGGAPPEVCVVRRFDDDTQKIEYVEPDAPVHVYVATCEWFALCENAATHDEPHPVLGGVPCCDRCAKIGQ